MLQINKTVTEPTTQTDFYYTYGPVFNDSFMLEVMDLQLQIMEVGDVLIKIAWASYSEVDSFHWARGELWGTLMIIKLCFRVVHLIKLWVATPWGPCRD